MAKGIAHREWAIHRDDYQTDEGFREAVQGELAMCENIGERLGVAIVAAPMRTRMRQPGASWMTVGWIFKTATVPAAASEPEEEVDPFDGLDLAEPEPVEAE